MKVYVVSHCPRCYSRRLRPSSRRRRLDSLMAVVLHDPYRCNGCRLRFYLFRIGVIRKGLALLETAGDLRLTRILAVLFDRIRRAPVFGWR